MLKAHPMQEMHQLYSIEVKEGSTIEELITAANLVAPVDSKGEPEDLRLDLIRRDLRWDGRFECRLFEPRRPIADFVEEMRSTGWEPARIEHLLAFARKHPELQEKEPIVGLGTAVYTVCDRHRMESYFHLGMSEKKRVLSLQSFFFHSPRALAIRRL